MKKMFILLAIASLAFASCSKEDIPPKMNSTSSKDSWIITQKGVNVDGVKCNQLTNKGTSQSIYEAINEGSHNNQAKTEPWTHSLRIETNQEAKCDGTDAKNCFYSTKGEIVLKKNTSTN